MKSMKRLLKLKLSKYMGLKKPAETFVDHIQPAPSSTDRKAGLPLSSDYESAPSSAEFPAPPWVKRTLRKFTLAEIKTATNNFDQDLVIWESYFSGEVYKSTIYEYVGTKKIEKTVAIRSFSIHSTQLFEEQIYVWYQYCHEHIVSVIGYCNESYRMLVVYDYMPDGSLANHLCEKSTTSTFTLSSEQCLHICIGAARGLEYMCTAIKLSNGNFFFHGDVSVTNILLDKNGVSKISDLYSELLLSSYTCRDDFYPEFRIEHYDRSSVPVYAFGVLLIKVMSRKVSFDAEDENLGEWLQQEIVNGTIDHIIHPDMKAHISPDRLKELVHIAGECLNTNSKDRPTMSQVVKRLEFAMASSARRNTHRYSLYEMEEATNNFESILGEGGEGKVYKGVTKANINVAVKRLKPDYSSEFEREIEMVSKLHHPNLVSLLGYCDESDEKMLVYEYIQNGNLRNALKESSLSWEQCLNICVGIARGLRHLHTSTKDLPKGIIHRDMKPANILLDDNFVAKISDFGLCKMSIRDQVNSEMATRLKGTIGYFAPECIIQPTTITRKIDVYSFGVIVFEVLCRKKPLERGEDSFYASENEKYSLWAKQNVDPNLKGEISPECLQGFTDILEKCLNKNPKMRPSMNEVVSALENAQEWQEAWQKNDGGLFYTLRAEDRVVIYYTSNRRESSRTLDYCLKVRLFLRRFGVVIDERDVTKDQYSKEFKQVFGKLKDIRLPIVFIRGKYVGGVEILCKTGQLAKLLNVSPPCFICQYCEEAMACDECTRNQWYLLCKNCDALTIVSKDWEVESRNCLHCNRNALIRKSILETQY